MGRSSKNSGGVPASGNTSSDTVNDNGAQKSESLISVETKQLKEKLNRVFVHMHESPLNRRKKANNASFDRLWDLKEVAILEGRNTIDLPSQWLAELDETVNQFVDLDPQTRKH